MTMKNVLVVTTAMVAATLAGSISCSPTFEPKSCSSDTDCGGELVCLARASTVRTCVSAAEAPLRIGQSAVASGPSGDLGLEMRRGIQLAFDDQNARGGVRGRKLELDFLDDQYTPAIAEANARTLVDAVPGPGAPRCPTTQTPPVAGQDPFSQTALLAGPNAVTAVIGSVGTPTMVRAAPVIVETGTLYFGAFTGATAMLRDQKAGPCARYIFNVRASYAQEARATLEFFFALKVPDDRHLISFDQNDTFGDAGYNGLVAAYQAIRDVPPSIQRFRYTREDPASVPTQITAAIGYLRSLLQSDSLPHTVGVMMTDTYGPATQFVKAVKDWQYATDPEQTTLNKATRLSVYFSNVSFVGPNSLAARLRDAGNVATPGGPKPYTSGVFVSQVVPNYDSDNSDVVVDYKRLVGPTGAAPTFTALEGYIAGRVFVEGLKNTTGSFTADNMVTAFETLRAGNLGLGASAGFSKDKHQYSQSVYGTEITPEGRFQNRYFWSDGSPIQLFE
ncbi:MAG: putative leucine/isoleucine/valine-binding protein precursor [Labilithrix sp.]|nr:putative leucine/isoleucine/valine-binding protein precursor [Labilithrix sp.]